MILAVFAEFCNIDLVVYFIVREIGVLPKDLEFAVDIDRVVTVRGYFQFYIFLSVIVEREIEFAVFICLYFGFAPYPVCFFENIFNHISVFLSVFQELIIFIHYITIINKCQEFAKVASSSP